MKTEYKAEKIGSGTAIYSNTSGKIEMVGYVKNLTEIDKLGLLILDSAKVLAINANVDIDDLGIAQKFITVKLPNISKRTGLFIYPDIGIDEDIDGTVNTFPGFNVFEFWPDKTGATEEQCLHGTKPVGIVDACRHVVTWMIRMSQPDPVKTVMTKILPNEYIE